MTIVPFLNNLNKLIINPLIILVFTLAFAYFVYGIVRFLSTDPSDKSTERTEARSAILWGIVGMVIMFSVYGLIGFVLKTFGIAPSDIQNNDVKDIINYTN